MLLSLTWMVGPTMNLISGTHHLCERREYTFMVLQEYTISPLKHLFFLGYEMKSFYLGMWVMFQWYIITRMVANQWHLRIQLGMQPFPFFVIIFFFPCCVSRQWLKCLLLYRSLASTSHYQSTNKVLSTCFSIFQ